MMLTHVVDWVHPSVRDVVINFLMSHDAERIRFLSTAGVDGLALAVSTAGGSAGERHMPLLRRDADWDAFQGRLLELAAEGEPEGQLSVIQSISTSLTARTNDCNVHDRLVGVVGQCLDTVRQSWDRRGDPLEAQALEEFFRLSVAARIYVPPPDMENTWSRVRAVVAKFVVSLEQLAPSDELPYPSSLREPRRILALLGAQEPRLLECLGFPSDERPLLVRLQAQLMKILESIPDRDPLEQEEYWLHRGSTRLVPATPDEQEDAEREFLDGVGDFVLVVTGLLSYKLQTDFRRIGEAIIAKLQVLEQRHERWEEDHPDSDRGRGEDDEEQERSQGAGDFDIDEFFADL